MQPTSVLLCLPLDESDTTFSNALRHLRSVGSSAMVVQVSPDYDLRGYSHVAFASLLHLGNQCPNIRQLQLRISVLEREGLEIPLCSTPCFAFLDTLIIDPGFAALSAGASITNYLFDLFSYMPRLRNLSVYSPQARPHVEHIACAKHLPVPPFSLETFVCTGTLPALAYTQIIAHSHRTLSELRITVVAHMDNDEARLVAAIAQAAPQLRLLDLRLRRDERLLQRVQPVFAALARLRTLRLETPRFVELADALALLAHAPAEIPLRTLTLRSARAQDDPPDSMHRVKQLAEEMPQMRRLLSVVLLGFDIGDEDRRELVELWRARRVRCRIYY